MMFYYLNLLTATKSVRETEPFGRIVFNLSQVIRREELGRVRTKNSVIKFGHKTDQ